MSTHANQGPVDLADANRVPMAPTPLIAAISDTLLIAGLTLAIYLPSLRGPFIIDDDRYLTENSRSKPHRNCAPISSEQTADAQAHNGQSCQARRQSR